MANTNDEGSFDPETITLLADVLDRVWKSLPVELHPATTRADVAEYILTLAAHGERSTAKLYESVFAHFTKPRK